MWKNKEAKKVVPKKVMYFLRFGHFVFFFSGIRDGVGEGRADRKRKWLGPYTINQECGHIMRNGNV